MAKGTVSELCKREVRFCFWAMASAGFTRRDVFLLTAADARCEAKTRESKYFSVLPMMHYRRMENFGSRDMTMICPIGASSNYKCPSNATGRYTGGHAYVDERPRHARMPYKNFCLQMIRGDDFSLFTPARGTPSARRLRHKTKRSRNFCPNAKLTI